MDAPDFRIIPPPDSLARDVECFRLSTYSGPTELGIRVCPNGLPGILFQQQAGESAIRNITTVTGRKVVPPPLFVYGQVTELAVMNFKTPFTTLQVLLKPYALKPLLGLDAASLTNGSVGADGFGGTDLNPRLVSASGDSERINILTEFLEAKLDEQHQAGTERDTLVEQSVELIQADIENVSVKSLLEKLYISERQFERRFLQTVGVSPQFFIRVRRVNEAMRLMDGDQYERLSDVAQALNFHDQSHFIRDIKAFSGITPKSISQKVQDFHRDEVGSSYLSM